MRVEMRIRSLVGDIHDDVAAKTAEALLQSAEQGAPELIVFPEHDDLLLRIEGLNIVRVNAALGPERWLPADRPVIGARVAPVVITGGNEELGDLPLVQEFADSKVGLRSERAEHQQDVVAFHQSAGEIERV